MKSILSRPALLLLAALILGPLIRAQTTPVLTQIADPTVWRIQNRNATSFDRAGRKAVRLDAQPQGGIAWLVGSDFCSGTIELDLRGSNTPGRSFVGIAFHGTDLTTYDAVYFRPFNFQNPDPIRRAHSVQYISQPAFSWEKLRAESPGKYEQPITPPPDPDGWFHARIVVEGQAIRVFVNAATTPSLVVTALNGRRGGLLGLWVGNDSAGDFSNLSIAPAK